MNFEAMPRIRIEVEQMKQAIICQMGVLNSELGDIIGNEISKAIEAYDWKKEVTNVVHNTLTEMVKSYFTFGEGYKAIKQAVENGFKEMSLKEEAM